MIRQRGSTTDLPLIRWAEQLRCDKRRRRKIRNRACTIGLGLSVLVGTIILPPAPRLIWNASASAPVGLYVVHPGAHVATGDIVIAKLPLTMRKLAADRRYLPASVPLVKQVVAGPGDIVCASATRIFVNGRWLVSRRPADVAGRPMPWWTGCHILHDRQYFLAMPSVPTSFDGRYFGITQASDIVGRAYLMWARPPEGSSDD